MGQEFITVTAGGQNWSAFEEVTVEAAFDHAARSFSLTVSAEPGALATAWALAPGTSMSINFSTMQGTDGDLALTGYIDRYNPKLTKKGGRIGIHGRSKSQDMIDCAAVNAQGSFKNQTLLQIGQALDQFGVGVSTDQTLEPIDSYQVTPGETVFECLEKLARKSGLTLTSPPDGSLFITKAGTQRHAGALIEGQNFVGAEADLDWSNRHSDIIVRGQAADGTGAAATQITATAKDTSLGRYRPVVIIEDGDLDQDDAQTRADTRRDREAGESLTASGEVQGFRDAAGKLWTPGYLIWTESSFLNVTQLMLIKKATFNQKKPGGSNTTLELVDPRAFGGTSGKGGSAGSAWNIDEED
jgi:prophage tail gpP-like protein